MCIWKWLGSTAIVAAFSLASSRTSDAGPVKHWGTFPNHEVRSIALRGDELGAEPSFTVVQGRDGYVYVRGRFGLYRLLDDVGNYQRVADTSQCSGYFESYGVDNRSSVPRALCSRASQIIIAGSSDHVHIQTPVPGWNGSIVRGGYVMDYRYLTAVLPAGGGGYWFSYGMAGGVGRVTPSGPSVLRHYGALGKIHSMVAIGEDVYVASGACSVTHIRRWRVLDAHDFECGEFWPRERLAVGADQSVWALGGTSGKLERWGRDGSHARWKLAMIPLAVAVAHDGTAYVLGLERSDFRGHPLIALIVPGRRPEIRTLPMSEVGTMAVDGRDRLWITVPSAHSVALIAPKERRTASR